MARSRRNRHRPTVGIIGFGAFGQLIAQHIAQDVTLMVYDPSLPEGAKCVPLVPLETAARCDIVILATPVSRIEEVVISIAPDLRAGALVLDVGSVKVLPADVMRRHLPPHVDIIATHPLFGPQSAKDGIAGLKIAICPVRGSRHHLLAWYLRRVLNLDVILTTPDAHDRDAAIVQGLTHLIARVLTDMHPLPTTMTTKSYDLLMQAIAMVHNDAPEVFDAIERSNPYSKDVRRRFFERAAKLQAQLEHGCD